VEELGSYLKVKVKVSFSLKQATKTQGVRCLCAATKYFLVSKITLQYYRKYPTGQAESQLCGGNYIGSVLTVAYRRGFGVQPPEITKALQNHPKLNPIVKTV
jgi:phosphotransferase system  glucose/maltose/N-acetylglucosamine-specific IIC component